MTCSFHQAREKKAFGFSSCYEYCLAIRSLFVAREEVDPFDLTARVVLRGVRNGKLRALTYSVFASFSPSPRHQRFP